MNHNSKDYEGVGMFHKIASLKNRLKMMIGQYWLGENRFRDQPEASHYRILETD